MVTFQLQNIPVSFCNLVTRTFYFTGFQSVTYGCEVRFDYKLIDLRVSKVCRVKLDFRILPSSEWKLWANNKGESNYRHGGLCGLPSSHLLHTWRVKS